MTPETDIQPQDQAVSELLRRAEAHVGRPYIEDPDTPEPEYVRAWRQYRVPAPPPKRLDHDARRQWTATLADRMQAIELNRQFDRMNLDRPTPNRRNEDHESSDRAPTPPSWRSRARTLAAEGVQLPVVDEESIE